MIIDGRELAKQLKNILANQVSHAGVVPHLTVITCQPGFATQKYINLKKKTAEAAGIAVNIVELPDEATTEDVVNTIQYATMQTDGVIVQLPLPNNIDRDKVVAAMPEHLDVDGMHYAATGQGFLPPVVAAIQEIAQQNGVVLHNQKVAVIGAGILVGKPAALWAADQGAQVTTITEETVDSEAILQAADIIITGAGVPGLVTLDKVKEGVVIFDAATSEDNGELRGDVDPSVAQKASLFTPVPGGIGPLTVVMLLRNVLLSAEHNL